MRVGRSGGINAYEQAVSHPLSAVSPRRWTSVATTNVSADRARLFVYSPNPSIQTAYTARAALCLNTSFFAPVTINCLLGALPRPAAVPPVTRPFLAATCNFPSTMYAPVNVSRVVHNAFN